MDPQLNPRQATLGLMMQSHQNSLHSLFHVEQEDKGIPTYVLPTQERVTEFGFTVLTPDTVSIMNQVNAHPQCSNLMIVPTDTDKHCEQSGMVLCLRVARSATSIEFIPLHLCTLTHQ